VFKDAKLSTVIAIVRRTLSDDLRTEPFMSRVHPANVISEESPSLTLAAADIPLYDPSNLTVVSCSQADWELAVRIMQTGRFQRLGSICTSYQGEVNETNDESFLSSDPTNGPQVLRGSNVSLYALRTASQGESLYLDEAGFLQGKDPKSKAQQSREQRIGFQRSSPQNNFRRIVACPVPRDQFCFDTISYVPYSECRVSPHLLLALLNSKLLDWYFRLGSTNSKVNEYQFDNLPCPVFSEDRDLKDRDTVMRAIESGNFDVALRLLSPSFKTAAFTATVSDAIVSAATRIIAIEAARGEVNKKSRAALSEQAQPYQDFIDRVLFAMAGLSVDEAQGLEQRLAVMM
jgi:hypothetical protein